MGWEGIIEEVKKFKKKNKNTWFRGQGDSNWELKSSLFRQKFTKLEEFKINERTRYNLFKNLGHIYHNEDDWNLVYVMQHHGVKTRLLDWSESFATALYFASQNWVNNNSITVWMLNPLKLNQKTLGAHKFFTTNKDLFRERLHEEEKKSFLNNSIALHPLRNNQRIVAQQGVFTVQGNTLEALDKEFNGNLINEGILSRIDIEFKYREDVHAFLELSGIHPFSIFPDLEGLSKYINNRTDNF